MSLLAKILVVLQTVLALVFLGVQATLYYHAQDWRLAFERLRERHVTVLKEKQQSYETLKADKGVLEESLSKRVQEVKDAMDNSQRAEDKSREYQGQLSDEKRKYDELSSTHQTLAGTVKEKDDDNKKLREENDRVTADRDTFRDNAAKAEAQVARLLHVRTALEKDLTQIRKDYTDAKQKAIDLQLVLDELERAGVPVGTIVLNYKPVPPIKGKVAGVKTDISPALVVLTVGVDDKVEKGYHFTVYRGSQFIGKVVVEKVMADAAGARVLLLAPGQQIQAGDDAATRLD